MLLNYQQFIVKHGARTQLHLTNPVVTPTLEIQPPRQSVIHLLDYHNADSFVERTNHYLTNIKGGKKIPVHNVTALAETAEVTMTANKTLNRDLQAWRRDHNQEFRLVDLLQTPNTDIQINSVINYNLLKTLYNYKSTVTAPLSKYNNIYTTYWDTVKQAIKTDPSALQFVRLDVPTLIPSVTIFDRVVTFKPALYARVVHNTDLNGLVQLYKFLDPKLRVSSTMRSLTDEDTKQVVVELAYKGYSTFFRLSDLVSLSKLSDLESKRKLELKQLHRFYVSVILKLQAKVLSLENSEASDQPTEPEPVTVGEEDPELEEPERQAVTAPQQSTDKLTALSKDAGDYSVAVDDINEQITSMSDIEVLSDDVFSKLIGDSIAQLDADSEPLPNEDPSEVQDPNKVHLHVDYSEEHAERLLKSKTTSENFETYITTAKTSGVISTVEARSLKKLYETRASLKSPYNDTPIDQDRIVTREHVAITQEEIALPIDNPLVDDSLKSDIIGISDKKYINTVLKKDILACLTNLEKADIIIKAYEVETNRSALGNYDLHKVTFKPYRGKESTVYFRIPHINDEGEMTASSVKYRMRKVRADVPIRKISPTRVALTTNYGKLFIFRTDRKSFDTSEQIVDFIKSDYLRGGATVKQVTPGNVFNNYKDLPNDYMVMSRNFRGFVTQEHTFIFSEQDAKLVVKQELLDEIASKGMVFVGYANSSKSPLAMGTDGQVVDYKTSSVLGTVSDLLGMDKAKLPVQFSMMKVLGDNLPLGVVLGYYIGLNNLLAATKTQFQLLPARKQYQTQANEIIIRTNDAKLVIAADTQEKRLIFGGFAFYKDFIKTTDLDSLNNKSVYLDVIEQRGATTMHLRELDVLERIFIDPISARVLEGMKEPTDYLKLLLRANELLKDYKHPDVNDANFSRIRSYDRVPGLMYRAISESVRAQKMGSTRGKVELDPYKVWNAVVQDTTTKITEDSNPITDVKEMESGTFGGADGLNKDSTPEIMRRFHASDKGLISEATVDSSDVGLNFYLTPYPKLKDLDGTVKQQDTPDDKVFSTSVLLAPMAENDDPKRI